MTRSGRGFEGGRNAPSVELHTPIDHYAVLGVLKDADDRAIKSAWRKAVMETHPDRHPNDPEAEARFRAFADAYEVLGDEKKRRVYDALQNTTPAVSRTRKAVKPPPPRERMGIDALSPKEQQMRNFLNVTFFSARFADAMKDCKGITLDARNKLRGEFETYLEGVPYRDRVAFSIRFEDLAQTCCREYVEAFLEPEAFAQIFMRAMGNNYGARIGVVVEVQRKFEQVIQGMSVKSREPLREQFKAMLARAIVREFGEDD